MSGDFYDGLRAFNVAVSLIIFALMIVQFHRYAAWPEQVRLLGMGLLLLVGANAYAAIESFLRRIPGGPRVAVTTIPLLVILIALLWPYIRHWQRMRRRRQRSGRTP